MKKKNIQSPMFLLLVAAFMVPLGGTNYFQILFAYAVFAITLQRDKGKIVFRDSVIKNYTLYYIVFNCVGLIIGLTNGVGLRDSLADLVSSTIPLICMLIGSNFAELFSEKQQYKTLAVILFVEFLFGLGQTYNVGFRRWSFDFYGSAGRLHSYSAEDVGRAVGTIGSPNYYGLLCVIIGAFFICSFFNQNTRKGKFRQALFVAITIVCVVFSVSKTAVVCIAVAVIMCILLSSSMKNYQKVLVFVLSLIVVAYAIPAFETYSNRMIDISSMSGRTGTWQTLLDEYFFPKPLRAVFGYGNAYASQKTFGTYVDSFYLILLLNRGIIGAFFYLLVWILAFCQIARYRRSFYRTYALTLIIIVILADITAAITDMVLLSITVYYLIGRYSRLAYLYDKQEAEQCMT